MPHAKTPHICKKVFGDGRVLSTAYKRPQTMKNGHEWWKHVYDEFYDCVEICPEYQPLKYSTTNRDGYREYKSDPNICAACPTRERCTHSRDCIKTVQRHIWKDYEELADDARYTPGVRAGSLQVPKKKPLNGSLRTPRKTRDALYAIQRLGSR